MAIFVDLPLGSFTIMRNGARSQHIHSITVLAIAILRFYFIDANKLTYRLFFLENISNSQNTVYQQKYL
jgi:hypothetical protein